MAVTEESKLAQKVQEQSSEIKFSDEEIKSLNDLNQSYQTKQSHFCLISSISCFNSFTLCINSGTNRL